MKPVCLITGAGGRLGAALCEALLATHDIVAIYRSRLPPVSTQFRTRVANIGDYDPETDPGGAVHAVRADLTRGEERRRVTDIALARFGRVDSIVNAAADTRFHGRLTELWDHEDAVRRQLDMNCVVPLALVSTIHQAAWKHEPQENARRNRCVVNVSSASALIVGQPSGQAFYSASKAALNMLTMYLSLELAPYSVRVNAICPGGFTDPAATARVVAAIRTLLDGEGTGKVVSRL